VNPANNEPYVAPYVQVRHAIHLLYATSPYSRDGFHEPGAVRRTDKHGKPQPLEVHGCGCSLCADKRRSGLEFWEAR